MGRKYSDELDSKFGMLQGLEISYNTKMFLGIPFQLAIWPKEKK